MSQPTLHHINLKPIIKITDMKTSSINSKLVVNKSIVTRFNDSKSDAITILITANRNITILITA